MHKRLSATTLVKWSFGSDLRTFDFGGSSESSDEGGARSVAQDSHCVFVSSELVDVPVDPDEGRVDVGQTVVAAGGRVHGLGQSATGQESQNLRCKTGVSLEFPRVAAILAWESTTDKRRDLPPVGS